VFFDSGVILLGNETALLLWLERANLFTTNLLLLTAALGAIWSGIEKASYSKIKTRQLI